ncbi:MAG: PTS transporter subunit EIIC [Oscillospiraceae bacterium]|nr:PTS transporter subunit EIIC [Oscillospiraceae bacterium]
MAQAESTRKLAEAILQAVGGKENVSGVSHCMTRLRFNLKDESVPQESVIKQIPGVLGLMNAGGQLQIIIGQTVDKVYEQICGLAGLQQGEQINENLDTPKPDEPKAKKKWTVGSFFKGMMDGLSGCLTPLIPLLMAASLFKMLAAVFGPGMLNLIAADSDLYTLFTFVGDAGFYFFPIVIGYTAAKKFGATPVIGMFLGAIMLHPTFTGMAAEGASFTVFGIPCAVSNYASTIVPIILCVWVLSWIEKFLKRWLPTALKILFVPFLSVLIMVPITLCVLAPAGAFIGNYICNFLLGFANLGGVFSILAVALVSALWQYLVFTGMHLVLYSALIFVFTAEGSESLVLPGAIMGSLAVAGMCLGAMIRVKNKEERSLCVGYFVASIIGGVTEPGLYGLGIRYKRPLIGMTAGAFAGGLYCGIAGVTATTLTATANFLCLTGFVGGSAANLVNGIIAGVISFAVATVVTYFTGFKKDSPALQKQG